MNLRKDLFLPARKAAAHHLSRRGKSVGSYDTPSGPAERPRVTGVMLEPQQRPVRLAAATGCVHQQRFAWLDPYSRPMPQQGPSPGSEDHGHDHGDKKIEYVVGIDTDSRAHTYVIVNSHTGARECCEAFPVGSARM